MRPLVVLIVVVAACAGETVTSTTEDTSVAEFAAEVTRLESEFATQQGDNDRLTTENEELRAEAATLRDTVEHLTDEAGQLEDYVSDLESDFAEWVSYAISLEETIVGLKKALASATAGPTVQWCAEYLLALENAAYARLRPATDPLVIDGIQYLPGMPGETMNAGRYLSEVVEPLESAGCPRPEGW